MGVTSLYTCALWSLSPVASPQESPAGTEGPLSPRQGLGALHPNMAHGTGVTFRPLKRRGPRGNRKWIICQQVWGKTERRSCRVLRGLGGSRRIPPVLASSPAPRSLCPSRSHHSHSVALWKGLRDLVLERPGPQLSRPCPNTLGWLCTTHSAPRNTFTALLAQEKLVGKQSLCVPRAEPMSLFSLA